MPNEISQIPLVGVERSKASPFAADGTALECVNLRPTADGLNLVHEKGVTYTARLNGKDINIIKVFRHKALPKGYYIFAFRTDKGVDLTLYKPNHYSPTTLEASDKFASYNEDILAFGELNNVLVVRTESGQDFYIWHDNKYSHMPAVGMPKNMVLSQQYDESAPKNMFDRPFFEQVIGIATPHYGSDGISDGDIDAWDNAYQDNVKANLKFLQGLRAEKEAKMKRIGKFVGHVLVRCAFKTDQNNYISYGPVLHAEIGDWAGIERRSCWPTGTDKERGAEWYERLYYKLIDDAKGASSGWDFDRDGEKVDNELRWAYPICEIIKGSSISFKKEDNVLACNAGFSQAPVYVGELPDPLYNDDKVRSGGDGGLRKDRGSKKKDVGYRGRIGVYAPSVPYSYPILKIQMTKEQKESLSFYEDTGLIESFCIAMTAPVGHGAGNDLYKVRSIEAHMAFSGFKSGSNTGGKEKPFPMMSVYGKPTNYDIKPEKFLDKVFYIVKDIPIKNLVEMWNKSTGMIEVPIQLNELGVKENYDSNGKLMLETDTEEVAFSQEEQIDTTRVSLTTIEMAKPLPVDNFTNHTFLGTSFLEYNRRIHLFGVKTLFGDGFLPSPPVDVSQNGFGAHRIVRKGDAGFVDNLYMEVIIDAENAKIVKRLPLTQYMLAKSTVNGQTGEYMVLSDILTYPDYRAKTFRIVRKVGNGERDFTVLNEKNGKPCEYECKSSILNNIAYHAFTSDNVNDLPDIRVWGKIKDHEEVKGTAPVRWTYWFQKRKTADKNNAPTIVIADGLHKASSDDEARWGILDKSWAPNMYAFKDDDTLIYMPAYVDINKILGNREKNAVYDTGIEFSGSYVEGNRVQVSETDDVFSYPAKNSYRAGTLENNIIAANSVYGQVTEQKFGMFPLYLFTEEGIFTMEQGTGTILYSNVAKINEDRLTYNESICTTGDAIAYVVADGLRLIAGKTSKQVSDKVDGGLFTKVAEKEAFEEAIKGFIHILSTQRFPEEIQKGKLFYDSYNHDVCILCDSDRKDTTIWAFNTKSGHFYKRFDNYCRHEEGGEFVGKEGLVNNENNILWAVKKSVNGSHQISFYDFDTSDKEEKDGFPDMQDILYVSNPLKLGSTDYKHVERSIFRMFGTDIDITVRWFGSLDARKWFPLGGSAKQAEDYSDMPMRRHARSARYYIFVVSGKASKMQVNRMDMEFRAVYANKLR